MQPYTPTPPPPTAPYPYSYTPPQPQPADPLGLETPTLPGRRHVRTWPALLVLFFVAPIIGEVLSGSTPPLNFFTNPINALYLAALYGSGAILTRELVRRRGLGWSRILLLGAAYGILEEGLIVTSWFNPYWPDVLSLGNYGRLFQTNWVWAEGLTLYHMIFSITIPIVLTETLFPRLADRPWLGRKGYRGFIVLLTIISVLSAIGFGLLAFRDKGYLHPPIMYFGALALAIGLVVLALRLRKPAPVAPSPRRSPRLWTLRLAGFFGTILFFIFMWGVPNLIPVAIVTMVLYGAYAFFAIWRGRSWARRADWGPRQRLALASGGLAFFIFLLDPLIEFAGSAGKAETGSVVVGLAFLIFLIVLAWRARGEAKKQAQLATVPYTAPYAGSANYPLQ